MKYLLEIGTEELPYKFIPQAIEQLKMLDSEETKVSEAEDKAAEKGAPKYVA